MANRKTTNIEVRKNNRNSIYRYIRKADVTSNPNISYDLKISLPTVTQNTKELIEKGLVKEEGKLKSTGGKRAAALCAAADFKLAVGLDITRNHISLVLVDLKGTVLKSDRIFLPYEHRREYYEQVNRLLEQFVDISGADRERMLGIGISIPGIVNLDRKEISNSRVLHVDELPFQLISSFFSYPCYFLNDANAGAYAEGLHQENAKRFFYLSLSSTVGGAIYEEGELVQGKEFRCGEVGHMTIVLDGALCYCGKKGCLDAYCSADRLSDMADGSLEGFFQQLEEGKEEMVQAWDTYTSYLAVALDNISMVLDCDIIIGGYVGGYMEYHMEDLNRKLFEKNIFGKREPFIRPCIFKFEAAALGAALSVIEDFVDQI
ncbi:MAG TPA: ROK family transcriptional regulator [Candidatus Hungatella pullicola]|nr:ROK family transcriptional regulator [Candidatus Hungatella pullicola]